MRAITWAGLVAGAVALAGCSGGGPSMVEVEGTVTKDGKPLDKIQVEFWPEVDGPRSMAVTDAEGKFVLKADDGKRVGAVVGTHKVVLRDIGIWGDKLLGRAAEGVDLAKGKKPRVGKQYGDSTRTPLSKDVASGQKNVIDIEVK